MTSRQTEGWTTVLVSRNPAVLAIAKPLLDVAGIKYFAKGEGLQDLFALGRLGTGANPVVGAVQLQVSLTRADEARRLLQHLTH